MLYRYFSLLYLSFEIVYIITTCANDGHGQTPSFYQMTEIPWNTCHR